MTIDQIAEKLRKAGEFCVNPQYSLFSYRDGDWTLISCLFNSDDMAKEYHRYCLSGQWGDCLELRCNGVRVKLIDNLFDDTRLKSRSAELRIQFAKLLGVQPSQVCVDAQCTNSHEANFWIDRPTSGARMCLTYDSEHKCTMCVEYPLHKDGHFATLPCDTIDQLIAGFCFANTMLDDIREAIHEII